MFNFVDLNEETRPFILDAIDQAEKTGNIYYSSRFTDKGREEWLPLLKEAASKHNEHWLAYKLEENQLMKGFENAIRPSGGYSIKHVPLTASETFAEGQFNRFYILGLCKYAKHKGIANLLVYRAKESKVERLESNLLLNKQIPIDEIENQLLDIQSSFKSKLVQPNSGISVMLQKNEMG
jgi:hypothetical protein